MPASEAQKQANKRYYEKCKSDPIYKAKRAERQRQWRASKRNDPAYWEQNKPAQDNKEDAAPILPPGTVQSVWQSPSVTIVHAESHTYERDAIIESRKGYGRHYRLKIVVFSDSVEDLKKVARSCGFRKFNNTPTTF